MTGSSLGRIFHISTFGESHGKALGVIIDGTPSGLALKEGDIQKELDKRRPGQSSVTTTRKEPDQVEILSGIFEGKTLGTPIALIIKNKDQKSKDYEQLKSVYRPGHADYTYDAKYGIRDHRGGGRASGRETAARVAAGAVAKKILKPQKIQVFAYTLAVGDIFTKNIDLSSIESNPIRCPDKENSKEMIKLIEKVKNEGDSIGGIIEVVVKNCPPGIGDPVFNKLEATLSHALMSIGGIKGIEFGAGFSVTKLRGSQCNDALYTQNKKVKTKTNCAGGIAGGISNGEDIVIRLAVKPTASIHKKQQTINTNLQETELVVTGRHDPCLCPRIVPVAEAMVNIVVADHFLLQKAIR